MVRSREQLTTVSRSCRALSSTTAHSADIATAKTAAAIINADFFICNLPVDTSPFTGALYSFPIENPTNFGQDNQMAIFP